MKIEQIKVDELKPYPQNARTHSNKQIQQIKESIIEFGFTNPILIDKNNEVIAGHGRLESAKQLKMQDVPCIRLGYLTETQKKAYVLADNKLALNADWNIDLLSEEIQNLVAEDFNIDVIGFDEAELQELLNEIEDVLPEINDTEPDYEQMTFTFHKDQVEKIKEAIKYVKTNINEFQTENTNNNANAIHYMCLNELQNG